MLATVFCCHPILKKRWYSLASSIFKMDWNKSGWRCPAKCWILTHLYESRSFYVSPDLLLSWIGINPNKYDKTKKDDFKKSLEKTSNHLLRFNGIMKVKKEEEKIVIFQMNPLNRGHLQQLKIRQGLVWFTVALEQGHALLAFSVASFSFVSTWPDF